MKRTISQFLAVALLAVGTNLNGFAATNPGEVDFGKLAERDQTAKFVEVTLGRNLISIAARLVDKREPEVAKLLRSIELIRVNVVGLTDANRNDTSQRVLDLRRQLEKQHWERIVAVNEPGGEDVGIYLKARGEEAVEGIVITVLDGRKKEAVFVNIVGDLKPDQIAALGEALDIDPLKKAGATIKK